ncbi:hypothetical protein FUAX_15700 [Fulvitalea axinellae]|uniref:histidine kinase n=1 Tax=Fulvitalea axinellae TaxID=1182444 RepID=A0AAU9CMA8_9BACT|nr:hypothetical protein FUAX_15700 [Fulvitalea axinellae]
MLYRNIKILLIDDDEDDYIITKDILDNIPNRSYKLDWISDYREGMRTIRHNDYDVYLIDYRLGARTGLEIIKEAIESGCSKPLILLTGQVDQEIDDQAFQIGAADYIYKGALNEHVLDRAVRYSLRHNENLFKIRKLNEELEERVYVRTRELAHAFKKLKRTNDKLQLQIEERRSAEKALRQSQRLYRAIASNFPNGAIFVFDTMRQLVFADGKELELYGLSGADYVGWNLERLKGLGVDHEALQRHFEVVLNGSGVTFELEVKGNVYELYAEPLLNTFGFVKQVLVVAQNISERKKAEAEVRKMLEKEKQLNELKSRFVSMASHEFRTPLSSILSSASLISRYEEAAQQDRRMKHVNRIKSNVSNLTGILNDFLSISKLEEGKTIYKPVEMDLGSFCTEVAEEMQALAKPSQTLYYEHEGEGGDVVLDPQILKNVAMNLLSNAIKYSEDGTDIFFRTGIEGEDITLSVRDQGMGIPEAEQHLLFSRFFRAENATNIQGTGLGLNIVRKYVDLMGGSINFESVQGKGTTFSIRLPRFSTVEKRKI